MPLAALETFAALLAGFAVILLSAGLANRKDNAWLNQRMAAFVDTPAGNDILLYRTMGQKGQGTSTIRKFPGWSGLGIEKITLIQAGLVMTTRRFLGLQLLAAVVGLLASFFVSVRGGADGIIVLVFLVVGLGVGVRVPRWVVSFLRSRRLGKFEQRFPNTIDTIANALEAGMSLPQALDSLAREMPAPTGPEFRIVVRELNMGRSLTEALRGMLERVPSVDVDIFVTAVEIQYKIGGNLSHILRTISHTVRERLRIRSEIKVMTAQQRASSWIVTGAPLAIAMVVTFVNPDYMARLWEPGIGRVMLAYAVISVGIGFYVLQRIADIEV